MTRAWIVRAGAFVLFAAACSSGDGATTTVAPSTTTTAAPTTQAPTTTERPPPTVPPSTTTTAPPDPTFACTPAPDDVSVVSLPVPWAAGTMRQLNLEIARVRGDPGAGQGSSSTPVEVAVRESSESGFRMSWSLGLPTFLDMDLPQAAMDLLEPILSEIDGLALHYELDQLGVFGEVENGEELVETMLSMFEALEDLTGQNSADLRAIVDALGSEPLVAAISEDARLYHVFDGLEVPVGEALETTESLPNPFGDREIPARTTIEVVEVVDADGCVSISMRTSPDPEGLIDVIVDTLRNTPAGLSAEDEARMRAEGVEVEMSNEILGQFDHGTGVIYRIISIQRLRVGVDTSEDIKIITDVTPVS